MAKSNFSLLLGSSKQNTLRTTATAAILSLFMFVGSFNVGSVGMHLFKGGSIAQVFSETGFTGSGPTGSCPRGPCYKSGDTITVEDQLGSAYVRGRVTTTRWDGTKYQRQCALADLNCDGRITKEEWQFWSTMTVDEIRNRCRVLDCNYCHDNPQVCNNLPLNYTRLYDDLYNNYYLLVSRSFEEDSRRLFEGGIVNGQLGSLSGGSFGSMYGGFDFGSWGNGYYNLGNSSLGGAWKTNGTLDTETI